MKPQWIALYFPLAAAQNTPKPEASDSHAHCPASTEPRAESTPCQPLTAERVRALGHWAYQFTPSVSLHWPLHGRCAGILLEVAPSLSLFGGLPALCERIETGLQALNLDCRMGVSITATSAWWLSQTTLGNTHITEGTSLSALLPTLPAGIMDHAHPHRETLERCGIHFIHQLLQLPRSGLSRRFGAALLRELDCALGQHAELHTWLQPPPLFHMRRELPYHTHQLNGLLNTAQPLLEALQWWLQGQHAGTRCLRWTFHHGRAAARSLPPGDAQPPDATTRLIRSASPVQHATAWRQLLQDELTRQALTLEVCDITLDVDQLEALTPHSDSLFPGPREQEQAWNSLLDRLHARLGQDSLQIPRALPDPRPEAAHCLQQLFTAETIAPRKKPLPTERPLRLPRPLWYLPQAQRLSLRQNRPVHDGPLTFLAGPERIEFGWWSGPPTCRDYFIARDPEQRQLWIYRERDHARPTDRWYVQGLYA